MDSVFGINFGKSYYYDDMVGINNIVVDGDKDIVFVLFLVLGFDFDVGKKFDKFLDKFFKIDDLDKFKNIVVQIFGGGNGVMGQDYSDEDSFLDGSSGSSGSSGFSGDDSGGIIVNMGDCDVSSFYLNCNGDSSFDSSFDSSSSDEGDGEGSVFCFGVSVFVVIIVVCVLFWL